MTQHLRNNYGNLTPNDLPIYIQYMLHSRYMMCSNNTQTHTHTYDSLSFIWCVTQNKGPQLEQNPKICYGGKGANTEYI